MPVHDGKGYGGSNAGVQLTFNDYLRYFNIIDKYQYWLRFVSITIIILIIIIPSILTISTNIDEHKNILGIVDNDSIIHLFVVLIMMIVFFLCLIMKGQIDGGLKLCHRNVAYLHLLLYDRFKLILKNEKDVTEQDVQESLQELQNSFGEGDIVVWWTILYDSGFEYSDALYKYAMNNFTIVRTLAHTLIYLIIATILIIVGGTMFIYLLYYVIG